MMTPFGIELHIGQRWLELDKRFGCERIVVVRGWDTANEKVYLQGFVKSTASLRRFSGKNGGYIPVGVKQ